MKTGRPGEETVANALWGTVNVCRSAHIGLASPVTSLTRKKLDIALSTFVERGLTRISAWSYIWQLKSVFVKWCMPYCKDVGWEIPPLDLPSFRAKAPHYIRPRVEMLIRVKAWYKRQPGEHWFVATMMLEFAMCNGDVLRLKDANFIEKDSGHYLSYTPLFSDSAGFPAECRPVSSEVPKAQYKCRIFGRCSRRLEWTNKGLLTRWGKV